MHDDKVKILIDIVEKEDCPYCQIRVLSEIISKNYNLKNQLLAEAEKRSIGSPIICQMRK